MRKEPRFLEVVDQVYAILAGKSLIMWFGRAADYLEPEFENAKAKIGDLVKGEFSLLIYVPHPNTREQSLKWKYGLEEKPASVKTKTLEYIRKEHKAIAAAIERPCKNIWIGLHIFLTQ